MNVADITIDQLLDTVVRLRAHPDRDEISKKILPLGGLSNLEQWQADVEFNEHSQDPQEFAGMLEIIRGCGSLLEIGSRFGGTLRRMAEVLAPYSRITSVDLPMKDGSTLNPAPSLKANCLHIAKSGHKVELLLADSHDPETVRRVSDAGPYDFCFIDGDHSYEGVKADWENYGPMAKIIGFHDIINPPSQVDRLWAELKTQYRHKEIIFSQDSHMLGIGVIFK